MTKSRVDDIVVDTLPTMRDPRGALTVAELGTLLPFQVVRIFYIRDVPPGTVRGQHAHYRCNQYLLCQSGRVQLDMFDGTANRALVLGPGQGTLVPPGIFSSETYLEAGTILQVWCDRPYEKEDYIHTLDVFRAWRATA